MAVKFLDKTGLGYFWGKIKAWCNSTFAAIIHNQASNTINAMTGYSKPSSGSAIAASDSLNNAIGKLEAKVDTSLDDSNYVHKTGDESINGIKAFIGPRIRIDNSDPKLLFKDLSIERGTVSSSNIQNFALQGLDKNGRRTWSLMNEVTDHVANRFWLLCYKYSTIQGTSDNCVGLSLGYNSNDVAYSEIFGNLTVTANMACVTLHDTNITRNVAPSTDRYVWYCKNIDSNDANLSGVQHVYRTNKNSYLRLLAVKGTTTTSTNDDFAVFCLGFENDVAFASCPSTPDRNDIHDIVTRDWIPRDTRIVHTSGDESIAGIKDFTDSVYFLNDVFIKSDQPILRLRDTNNDRTVAPSSADYSDPIIFYDKDYNYLYRIRGGHDTNGSTRMYMLVYKEGATDTTASLGVAFDSNGNPHAYCPTPPANSSTTEIATAAWVNNKLSGVVHTTGNETVSGVKTFTNNPMIEKEYPSLEFRLAGTKRSVAPSSTYYWSFLNVLDDAGTPKRFFIFRGTYGTDKSSSLYLGLFKGTTTTETSGDSTTLGIGFDSSGNAYAWCPTPASSANNTHIATTEWVVAKGYLTSHQSLANCMKVNNTNTVSVFHLARRNADNSGICLSGGNGTDVGAGLQLYGPTATSAGRACLYARSSSQTKQFYATPDGTISWNGQAIHTASDERLKTPIEDVSSDILDVWENIQWGQFKFLEAVDEKGSSARFHVGLIAQAVDRIFKAHGSDVLGYGILCHDVQEATDERLDENGEVLEVAHKASDFWGVRYTEALCMEAAYQRRKNKILENRISELEKRLTKLEESMQ